MLHLVIWPARETQLLLPWALSVERSACPCATAVGQALEAVPLFWLQLLSHK